MNRNSKTFLLVVDVQLDFCPGGALAVPDGDQIVAGINQLMKRFTHIGFTQDWHPADHSSFASAHPGKSPFETISVDYGEQTLWPDHCIQGQEGARLHPELDTSRGELIIRKGYRRNIDSYSAFFENDRKTPTGLAGYLRDRGFGKLYICGLATDFCVGFSALDGVACGFEIVVIEDVCRAIDLDGSLAAMKQMFSDQGVTLCRSDDVPG